MKIATLITLLFCLCLSRVGAVVIGPILPPGETNATTIALNSLAMRIQAADMNSMYMRGEFARMEREVNRLETGFLILVVLFVATVAAVCLLTARDRSRPYRLAGVDLAKGPSETVVSRIPN